ncbi:hypothetical protein VNI00_006907 [Paramarasmius palmivorus]|uniref:MYND-type domain-containing protein n=1 Tax=Paramarasmius palmivorus TaxID=297713 RepID=A0AAW0D4C3_9AGAR
MSGQEAALADCYTYWVLALAYAPKFDGNMYEQSPVVTILNHSSLSIPPNRLNGKPRFCMKTDDGNEGLLFQLTELGVLQQVNADGLGNLAPGPIVEVLLNENQISHGCLKCFREGIAAVQFELRGAPIRLPKCAGCSAAYYCGKNCRKEDQKAHKRECKNKLWRYDQRDKAARRMENAQRAEMANFLDMHGFTVLNV